MLCMILHPRIKNVPQVVLAEVQNRQNSEFLCELVLFVHPKGSELGDGVDFVLVGVQHHVELLVVVAMARDEFENH